MTKRGQSTGVAGVCLAIAVAIGLGACLVALVGYLL